MIVLSYITNFIIESLISSRYFVNPVLLERVPSLFLLMGGTFALLQVIGLVLLRPPKDEHIEEFRSLSGNNNDISSNTSKDLSMKETLKTSQFWCLWTLMGMVQLCASFVYTYQKSYGLKFINDDAFFSYVGAVSNILNGSSRIFWGKAYDWKGFKVITGWKKNTLVLLNQKYF